MKTEVKKFLRNFLFFFNLNFNINYYQDIIAVGGYKLLQSQYNFSPSLLLQTVYPEFQWLPWKFQKTSRNFWESVKNQRIFLDWLGKKLGVTSMEDWYNVKTEVKKFPRNFQIFRIYKILVGGHYLRNIKEVYICHQLRCTRNKIGWHGNFRQRPWAFGQIPQIKKII